MPTRHLLLLDATGLTAYRWQSGHLHQDGHFPADDGGAPAFGEYLLGRRSSLFTLLADVAEEGFQIEDVPYVQGRDRTALVQRKLSQYYYGTPLSTAISLGRNKEGRRDEKILFAGLTGYAYLEPWLQALRQAEAQLVGLFAMPMVVAGVAAPFLGGSDHALAITITRSGLRQTFFEHGQLRFSRLTPMVTGTIEETAVACALETDKIYQYLASQRLLTRGTPLPVLVLAHPDDFEVVRARCPDTPERQLQFIDLADQARQAGCRSVPGDSRAEALFLHALQQKPPRQQFAPAEDRRFYRLWQANFALKAASLAIFGLGLLFAAGQAWDAASLHNANDELRRQIDDQRRRYDGILEGLPKIPISTDELRALTDRFDAVARRSPGPAPLLIHLSHGLDDSPDIELVRLDWRIGNGSEEGKTPVTTSPPAPGGAQPAGGGESFAVVELTAQLPAKLAGDPRAQQAAIDHLVRRLDDGERVRAQVLQRPFDTESGKVLHSAGEAAAAPGPQQFGLRLVEKL